MRTLLALLLLRLLAQTALSDTLTLAWDPVKEATSYKLYIALGQTAFVPSSTILAPITTITIGVSTQIVTRYYVTALYPATAFYPAGETGPSNIISYEPIPAAPLMVIEAPVMATTNVVVGVPVTITVRLRNDGTGPLTIAGGSLNVLVPGSTSADGPYILLMSLPGQSLAARTSATFSASWTATNALAGTWNCYLAIQAPTNMWTAGPFTPFSVGASQPPVPTTLPLPPTNLRSQGISVSSIDLYWDTFTPLPVSIERSRDAINFAAVGTAGPGVVAWMDTGLRRNTSYAYRLRSFNTAGFSPYTGTTVARTLRK